MMSVVLDCYFVINREIGISFFFVMSGPLIASYAAVWDVQMDKDRIFT